ncbi:hypothetical protein E2C01_002409 [Portunus trituberculatus]|uniref:Uncharacterized protein n=1 Tax=Portunus trituberculatus TaxID=210409 RepID=A0A5B7CLV4_PORTR|nr:hypothetical protein [Portunus trituberculatus]
MYEVSTGFIISSYTQRFTGSRGGKDERENTKVQKYRKKSLERRNTASYLPFFSHHGCPSRLLDHMSLLLLSFPGGGRSISSNVFLKHDWIAFSVFRSPCQGTPALIPSCVLHMIVTRLKSGLLSLA